MKIKTFSNLSTILLVMSFVNLLLYEWLGEPFEYVAIIFSFGSIYCSGRCIRKMINNDEKYRG